MYRVLRSIVFLAAVLGSVPAFANAVIESITGQVRAGVTAGTAAAVTVSQRIPTGATISTGANSRTVLRFDDGQAIVLHESTDFRVTDYGFNRADPRQDKFGFELLRGALRAVTGLLGQRSPTAFALRTPQATIGIRGTDFMVALANQTFTSVTTGSIGVTNAAGTAVFGPGSFGAVANAATLAAAVPASALPAGVASTFSQLGSVAVGASAGAAGASGAATGGISVGTIGAAAAAAAAAAAISNNNDNPSGTTGTTGTTGTR